MRTIFLPVMIWGLSMISLRAEPMPVVRAAEIATKFVASESIDGKPLSGLFTISRLEKFSMPDTKPGSIVWRASLEDLSPDQKITAIFEEGDKVNRRVLDIRRDGSVTLESISNAPRKMILKPMVVPKEPE